MDNVNVVNAVADVKVAEAAMEMLSESAGKSRKPSSRFKSLLKGGVMAAVLLGATVGGVSEASAQSPVSQWLSLMPVNGGVQRFDQNRDGKVDAISYDINRDGRVDAFRLDVNLGGYLDAVALDTDYNGIFNEYIIDIDRNGVLDTAFVDNNQDGHMDVMGFDPNGTGYYSGWKSLAAPAQQGRPYKYVPSGPYIGNLMTQMSNIESLWTKF
jgi:hypothetical protein